MKKKIRLLISVFIVIAILFVGVAACKSKPKNKKEPQRKLQIDEIVGEALDLAFKHRDPGSEEVFETEIKIKSPKEEKVLLNGKLRRPEKDGERLLFYLKIERETGTNEKHIVHYDGKYIYTQNAKKEKSKFESVDINKIFSIFEEPNFKSKYSIRNDIVLPFTLINIVLGGKEEGMKPLSFTRLENKIVDQEGKRYVFAFKINKNISLLKSLVGRAQEFSEAFISRIKKIIELQNFDVILEVNIVKNQILLKIEDIEMAIDNVSNIFKPDNKLSDVKLKENEPAEFPEKNEFISVKAKNLIFGQKAYEIDIDGQKFVLRTELDVNPDVCFEYFDIVKSSGSDKRIKFKKPNINNLDGKIKYRYSIFAENEKLIFDIYYNPYEYKQETAYIRLDTEWMRDKLVKPLENKNYKFHNDFSSQNIDIDPNNPYQAIVLDTTAYIRYLDEFKIPQDIKDFGAGDLFANNLVIKNDNKMEIRHILDMLIVLMGDPKVTPKEMVIDVKERIEWVKKHYSEDLSLSEAPLIEVLKALGLEKITFTRVEDETKLQRYMGYSLPSILPINIESIDSIEVPTKDSNGSIVIKNTSVDRVNKFTISKEDFDELVKFFEKTEKIEKDDSPQDKKNKVLEELNKLDGINVQYKIKIGTSTVEQQTRVINISTNKMLFPFISTKEIAEFKEAIFKSMFMIGGSLADMEIIIE